MLGIPGAARGLDARPVGVFHHDGPGRRGAQALGSGEEDLRIGLCLG